MSAARRVFAGHSRVFGMKRPRCHCGGAGRGGPARSGCAVSPLCAVLPTVPAAAAAAGPTRGHQPNHRTKPARTVQTVRMVPALPAGGVFANSCLVLAYHLKCHRPLIRPRSLVWFPHGKGSSRTLRRCCLESQRHNCMNKNNSH